ncbi:hypothetical protein A2U01_0053005 [Trifolium medium]|uniref:Uncharacterized protein n=1 Tax=Trifolium medium TaxID=97028 RepID=A0A392R5D5_9FABA|nr:hypothetical protein [Trifolium medium]
MLAQRRLARVGEQKQIVHVFLARTSELSRYASLWLAQRPLKNRHARCGSLTSSLSDHSRT